MILIQYFYIGDTGHVYPDVDQQQKKENTSFKKRIS